MTSVLPTPDDAQQPFWAYVTIAAIGKQIGMLQERWAQDESKSQEVAELEAEFQAVLFGDMGEGAPTLTEIAVKLDTLTPST